MMISMHNIAFVDDESDILDGLRRALRHNRKTWNIYFYESGRELLEANKSIKFDVVISDMRMPSMDGCKVLAAIKIVSPQTLRIVLSGYIGNEIILESLHMTHQFLAKPADSKKLICSIERALYLRDLISDDSIKETLGALESLPVLPAIYDELMAEISTGDGSISRIAKIINSDLALSSNILKIVNSAFFGTVRHIESPLQAATILGIDTIKNIALSTSILRTFSSDKKTLVKMTQINTRSQQLGLLIGKMTRNSNFLTDREKDHAQIAGMMVYIGELFSLCYRNTLSISNEGLSKTPFLGGCLLAYWGMPYPVIEAVRWFRCPEESNFDGATPLTLVHAAWSMSESCVDNGKVNWDHEQINKEYLASVVAEETLNQWVTIIENNLNSRNKTDD
jgi:HD-like signal output (HDOD) protein